MIGLFWIAQINYLLFHSLVELFSIVVAWGFFAVAWNTRQYQDNGYLLFIGIAFLFISFLDLIHTLAYKGMGVFSGSDADLPTQLWLAARYTQAFTLLIAPFFLRFKVKPGWVIAAYSLVTALFLAAIFTWRIFPAAFVEGVGLTPFKRYSEYLISAMFLASVVPLIQFRQRFDPTVLRLLIASNLSSVVMELTFSGYITVNDLTNMTGHFMKILSFYLIYKAIIETGLVKPVNLLFRDLKESEDALRAARDELELRVAERTAEVMEMNRALQDEIAGHHKTEAELREYREKLEDLVKARTAELQTENSERRRAEARAQKYAHQLERSNRELQDFAFIASHDLQEPMRKIRAFSDRLLANNTSNLNEEERDILARTQNAAVRMQRMLDDLLAYSRVATRPQPPTEVNLNEVLDEVLSDLEVRLDQTQGKVVVADLPLVEADPGQMRLLFQNLIGNALKFHRPGVPPQVRVYPVEPPEGFPCPAASVAVEDNGIGFETQQAELIFQPFQRLVGRSEYEGNGMGLAICQKIVQRHNGAIGVESRPGEGSRFIVTLPRRQPEMD